MKNNTTISLVTLFCKELMNEIQHIEELQNKEVKIEDIKTTFIVLSVHSQFIRFDFMNKKEAFLKQKESGILKYYTDHPLLINYNESHLDVYINSKPENPALFIEEIEKAIHITVEGSRDWKDYMNSAGIDSRTFFQNIEKGNGKFLTAPFSMVENIETVCKKHHVRLKSFGNKTVSPHKLIMINDQFVIAKDFRLHL